MAQGPEIREASECMVSAVEGTYGELARGLEKQALQLDPTVRDSSHSGLSGFWAFFRTMLIFVLKYTS